MPNVHVFTTDELAYEEAIIIIIAALKNLGLSTDSAITPHNHHMPFSGDGKNTSMPYIAVSSTSDQETDDIINELRKLNLGWDCEVWPTLRRFIPASEMRSE